MCATVRGVRDDRLRRLLEAADGVDAEAVERASYEVDLSLLRWFMKLSPRERLREASRSARMIERFRRRSADRG